MARHANNNDDELQRAAHDASNLLAARNAARGQQTSGGAGNAGRDSADLIRNHSATRRTRTGDNFANGTYERVSRPAQAHAARRKPASRMTLLEYISSNAVYIVGVAAVVAIVCVLLVAVKSCVPTETYDFDGELDFYYESPFDWNNLEMTDNGRFVYVDNGKVRSKTGIDVSENQGEIDWEAVASDGIDYAMIRLGYRGATTGELYTDALFADNLTGAKDAGVACGVYFFSQATSAKEARQEADFIVKQLDGVQLEYPVALDYETAVAGVDVPRGSNLGKDRMTEVAKAFCERIEKAGYRSMIYGNYYDLDLYHYESLQGRAIWWAEYDAWAPSPSLDIVMWQYSNGGWVEGIQAAVDMNIDLSDALG